MSTGVRVCAADRCSIEFVARDSRNIYCSAPCKVAQHRVGKGPRVVSEQERNKALLKLYGITFQEWDQLLEAQQGKCAICGTTEPGSGHNYMATDHDHETGKVRGLLCHKCNRGLGLFGDDPDNLLNAYTYLASQKVRV